MWDWLPESRWNQLIEIKLAYFTSISFAPIIVSIIEGARLMT